MGSGNYYLPLMDDTWKQKKSRMPFLTATCIAVRMHFPYNNCDFKDKSDSRGSNVSILLNFRVLHFREHKKS